MRDSGTESMAARASSAVPPWPATRSLIGYAAAILGVSALTGLLYWVPEATDNPGISLLYFVVVLGVALRYGGGAALFASLLAFFTFDLFLVEPHYRVTARQPEQWLALWIFLTTAVVTGQLVSRLQSQIAEARQRAREAAALADASWTVASQVSREAAMDEVLQQLCRVLHPKAAAILLPGEADNALEVVAWRGPREEALPDFTHGSAQSIARYVWERGRSVGWEEDEILPLPPGADTSPRGAAYLPLAMEGQVLGVLFVQRRDREERTPEQQRAAQSLANLAAVVLERDRLARSATRAQVLAETDRLKTALLSMVSHDFRSPLASIKASVGGLLQDRGAANRAVRTELLEGIDQEVDRLNRLVGNILALSRLEADAWKPQQEMTAVADLVGVVLASFPPEQRRRIQVWVSPDVEEVWLDPVQIGEAVRNLLDNALKYSPAESPVELRVSGSPEEHVIEVLDRGPGLPAGEVERLFDRFYRQPGLPESSLPGLGLGLAVCSGLVEAHRGRLTARNRECGGALFRITLPRPAYERRATAETETHSHESPRHR